MEACRLLSLWWYGKPNCLIRTHASRSKTGFDDQVGDVAPARSELKRAWIFSVEVKFHGPRGEAKKEPWLLEDILWTKKAPVLRFWRQCRQAAVAAGKRPLLLIKKNRKPWIAGLDEMDLIRVLGWQGPTTPDPRTRRLLCAPRYGLALVPLSYLLARTSPEAWLARWREVRPHAPPQDPRRTSLASRQSKHLVQRA